ncbi:MAG: hypothetical protein ACTHM7_16565 [Ginsengibacter sp.]|jgi:hypothetical protein|nr:hypothetical protein [Hanamia sp.]
MKLYSNNLLENLTKDELKNLTLEVKETMAKEFKNEKKRIFSVAQYWDIQRRKRNFNSKRFAF